MSIDFLVKLRDACAMIQEACDDELEKHNPNTTFKNQPEKIPWVRVLNSQGKPYERYPVYGQQATRTIEYTNLLETLKSHNNKFQQNGMFYWLFDDGVTIGRKPAKKR